MVVTFEKDPPLSNGTGPSHRRIPARSAVSRDPFGRARVRSEALSRAARGEAEALSKERLGRRFGVDVIKGITALKPRPPAQRKKKKTRSAVAAQRKSGSLPDRSYDLTGDGAVSQAEFRFSAACDRDRDGVLSDSEAKDASARFRSGERIPYHGAIRAATGLTPRMFHTTYGDGVKPLTLAEGETAETRTALGSRRAAEKAEKAREFSAKAEAILGPAFVDPPVKARVKFAETRAERNARAAGAGAADTAAESSHQMRNSAAGPGAAAEIPAAKTDPAKAAQTFRTRSELRESMRVTSNASSSVLLAERRGERPATASRVDLLRQRRHAEVQSLSAKALVCEREGRLNKAQRDELKLLEGAMRLAGARSVRTKEDIRAEYHAADVAKNAEIVARDDAQREEARRSRLDGSDVVAKPYHEQLPGWTRDPPKRRPRLSEGLTLGAENANTEGGGGGGASSRPGMTPREAMVAALASMRAGKRGVATGNETQQEKGVVETGAAEVKDRSTSSMRRPQTARASYGSTAAGVVTGGSPRGRDGFGRSGTFTLDLMWKRDMIDHTPTADIPPIEFNMLAPMYSSFSSDKVFREPYIPRVRSATPRGGGSRSGRSTPRTVTPGATGRTSVASFAAGTGEITAANEPHAGVSSARGGGGGIYPGARPTVGTGVTASSGDNFVDHASDKQTQQQQQQQRPASSSRVSMTNLLRRAATPVLTPRARPSSRGSMDVTWGDGGSEFDGGAGGGGDGDGVDIEQRQHLSGGGSSVSGDSAPGEDEIRITREIEEDAEAATHGLRASDRINSAPVTDATMAMEGARSAGINTLSDDHDHDHDHDHGHDGSKSSMSDIVDVGVGVDATQRVHHESSVPPHDLVRAPSRAAMTDPRAMTPDIDQVDNNDDDEEEDGKEEVEGEDTRVLERVRERQQVTVGRGGGGGAEPSSAPVPAGTAKKSTAGSASAVPPLWESGTPTPRHHHQRRGDRSTAEPVDDAEFTDHRAGDGGSDGDGNASTDRTVPTTAANHTPAASRGLSGEFATRGGHTPPRSGSAPPAPKPGRPGGLHSARSFHGSTNGGRSQLTPRGPRTRPRPRTARVTTTTTTAARQETPMGAAATATTANPPIDSTACAASKSTSALPGASRFAGSRPQTAPASRFRPGTPSLLEHGVRTSGFQALRETGKIA